MIALATLMAAQLAILLWLAPQLSLWLDEVLTVIGATQPDLASLTDYIRTVPGGTPLAFLPPRWAMQLFGNADAVTRLPSILAVVASSPAIYRLARSLHLKTPILAVALFAAMPLNVRYALEARPYALALCLTLWLTIAFLDRWSIPVYALLTLLATLAQPYAIFVPAAHLVWAAWRDRPRVTAPLAGILLSAAALIPWYLYFRPAWTPISAGQTSVTFDPRAPLVFLHEIAGTGYLGAALLISIAALGAMRLPHNRGFWITAVALPILAVPIANGAFHYFFSVRQVIYVLPLLTILFLAGAESLNAAKLLPPLLIAASLYADIQWLQRPRENWRAASNTAAQALTTGGCIQFLGDSTPLYLYFHPELRPRICTAPEPRVILATTPYSDPTEAVTALTSRGLARQSTHEFHGPTIEVFAQ